MKPKKLIAIDPGVSIGYSVWDIDKYRSADIAGALLQHGCSKSPKGEQREARIRRVAGLCKNLISIHGHHDLRIVAESQFYYPGMPAHLQKSIATCQGILALISASFVDYPLSTVEPKKWQGALLSGMGSKMNSKDKSLIRAQILTGEGYKDHNEADAVLIGVYWLDHLGWAKKIKEAEL